MKVFGVGDSGQPEIVEMPSFAPAEGSPMGRAVGWLDSALRDWPWCKSSKDQRYNAMAKGEFVKILVSLDDIITYIKSQTLSDDEAREFASFINSLKPGA